jgi:hypothetical protein
MQQGLNQWLQGEKPAAPKPLNHKDLLMMRAWFFHLAELATSEFWLNLIHCRLPKQTFVKYASLIYEPGATKLLFFLKKWPKNVLSLLLLVKCDQQQQTHKKNDVSNYGINLQKIILNSPITILPMFLAGEFSHKIEAVFCWVLWVWIMGSRNVTGLGYGSNTSVSYMLVVLIRKRIKVACLF